MASSHAHPEDYEVAYQAGYQKAREDIAAELSKRGQQMLVGLICDITNPKPEEHTR